MFMDSDSRNQWTYVDSSTVAGIKIAAVTTTLGILPLQTLCIHALLRNSVLNETDWCGGVLKAKFYNDIFDIDEILISTA